MSSDHNQTIGFERYKKNAFGREEYKQKRQSKHQLKEIRIDEAKKELLDTGEIKKILSVIGGGKEATVILALNEKDEFVCAKVFRFFTSTIKKRLHGTQHILANDMAALAARQEYWNLMQMREHVLVPKPISLMDNIVVMEFIPASSGLEDPAPLLRDVPLPKEKATEYLYDSIDILADLFLKGNFIHGDYSEHNLMINQNEELITMDVSQSVQFNIKTFINTPVRIRIDRAIEYLQTDISNINRYFKRIYRLEIDQEEVLDSIKGELPQNLKNFLNERTMEIYPSELYCEDVYIGKEGHRDNIYHNRTGFRRQKPK